MAGFSARSLKIARSIAETLFDPGTGTRIPSARLDWMASELADYTRLAGARTSNGLGLIMLGLQLLPLLVLGKPSRFTSLGFDDRHRFLVKVEKSRLLAPLLSALKIILSLVYFEHPDVLREAGVNPGCMRPGEAELPVLRTPSKRTA